MPRAAVQNNLLNAANGDRAELAEAMAKVLFDDVIELYRTERAPAETVVNGVNLDRFIHLRNVRCVLAGGTAIDIDYLRVHLRHVTAWTFPNPS